MMIAALVILYFIAAGVPIGMYIARRRAMNRLLASLRDSGIDIDDLLKK
jgi:uncharacterized protein YneF (UPF0154 family)